MDMISDEIVRLSEFAHPTPLLLQFLEPRTITENIQRQGFAPIEGAD